MKIRIYETDFEGNPVECTGEYFSGKTALDIVNAMKMNPFQASRTPQDFMRWIGGCFYSLSLIFVFSLAHYIIVMEVI